MQNLAFLLFSKYSSCFSPQDDSFVCDIAEILKKVLSENVKIALNFLFYFEYTGKKF